MGDGDFPAQGAGQALLHLAQIEGQVGAAIGLFGGLFPLLQGLDQGLGLADGQLVLHHLLGGLALEFGGGGGQNGPGVSGGQLFLLHQGQHLLRQGQQTEHVGDGRAGLAHALGHLLLGQAIVLHQHLIALGLLHRVQVLPLKVFDQAKLHDLPVIRLDDDGGDLVQSGGLGRPPPPLSGDDLIIARGQPPHRQGLDDPVDPDRLGQIGQ